MTKAKITHISRPIPATIWNGPSTNVRAGLEPLGTRIICKVFSPVLPLEQFIEQSDESARLLAHAHLLTRLNTLLFAALPTALSTCTKVVNYRQGRLIIHAPNGAIASKTRQLTPRLTAFFLQNGIECNQIDIKVQPKPARTETPAASKKPLTPESADAIRAGIRALPEGSPLALALQRLLERAVIQMS